MKKNLTEVWELFYDNGSLKVVSRYEKPKSITSDVKKKIAMKKPQYDFMCFLIDHFNEESFIDELGTMTKALDQVYTSESVVSVQEYAIKRKLEKGACHVN